MTVSLYVCRIVFHSMIIICHNEIIRWMLIGFKFPLEMQSWNEFVDASSVDGVKS